MAQEAMNGRRVVSAVGLALAAGTGAVVQVRRLLDRRAADGEANAAGGVRFQSRTARNAELAKLGGRAAGEYAAHRARKVFASAERSLELDREHALKTAESVVETLGNMKGLMMKIGQMQSFVGGGGDDPARAALAKLQADAPPMTAELAAEVVEQELGRAPDKAFAEWDPDPIAAASIGQVHRAITHDDRAVAVKVQYPGVDQAIRADLANVMMLGDLGSRFGANAGAVDAEPIIGELRDRILEELDYRQEAENQRFFGAAYRGHPFIHIPPVVDELSTRRVLTSELAEGVRFATLEGWSQDERDAAGEAIFRFVYRSIHRLGVFNGDPHPGNYLFQRGGRVTFLDFGLVKRLTPEHLAIEADLVRTAVLKPDPAAFTAVLRRCGWIKPDADVSSDSVFAFLGQSYHFLQAAEPAVPMGGLGSDPEAMGRVLRENPALIRALGGPPPDGIFVLRATAGLEALLARLGARAAWRGIAEELWPFTDGAPTTPMGEREKRWQTDQIL